MARFGLVMILLCILSSASCSMAPAPPQLCRPGTQCAAERWIAEVMLCPSPRFALSRYAWVPIGHEDVCTGVSDQEIGLIQVHGEQLIPLLISHIGDHRWTPWTYEDSYSSHSGSFGSVPLRRGELAAWLIEAIVTGDTHLSGTGPAVAASDLDPTTQRLALHRIEQDFRAWFALWRSGQRVGSDGKPLLPRIRWRPNPNVAE